MEEFKFKVGDVVTHNYLNCKYPILMTVEVQFPTELGNYEYQCTWFYRNELMRARYKQDDLLFHSEWKIIKERDIKIDELLREV